MSKLAGAKAAIDIAKNAGKAAVVVFFHSTNFILYYYNKVCVCIQGLGFAVAYKVLVSDPQERKIVEYYASNKK